MSRAARSRARSVISDFKLGTPADEIIADEAKKEGNAAETDREAATVPNDTKITSFSKQQQQTATREEEALAHAATTRCLVYCRLRPTKPNEYEPNDGSSFPLISLSKNRLAGTGAPQGQVHLKDNKSYEFDGAFGEQSTQEELFLSTAKPCVEHALNGFRSAIMAYGQTGTGKSFTMCNRKPGKEGVIYQAARLIFSTIEARKEEREYCVEGQFLQIYRDQLGDLMNENTISATTASPTTVMSAGGAGSSGGGKLDIVYDKSSGVTIPGCTAHTLNSVEDFMKLYEEGDARRAVAATQMNPESSRGHTALIVWITSVPRQSEGVNSVGAELRGKITFVDLAGYERFSKTGISANTNPIRKDEAKTINASLLSLGHVVSALSNRDKHVPWRNAKLTRLLQDSVGGASRTTILLTIGPSSDHLFETTNTLQFGQRAMAVKVQAKVNVSMDYEKLAGKLQAMLEQKEERINALEVEIAAHEAEQADLKTRQERDVEDMKKKHAVELSELRAAGTSEDTIGHVVRQQELEKDSMMEQQREELQYAVEEHDKQTRAIVNEQTHNKELQFVDEKMTLEATIEGLKDKILKLQMGKPLVDEEYYARVIAEKDAVIAERVTEIADLVVEVQTLRATLLDNNNNKEEVEGQTVDGAVMATPPPQRNEEEQEDGAASFRTARSATLSPGAHEITATIGEEEEAAPKKVPPITGLPPPPPPPAETHTHGNASFSPSSSPRTHVTPTSPRLLHHHNHHHRVVTPSLSGTFGGSASLSLTARFIDASQLHDIEEQHKAALENKHRRLLEVQYQLERQTKLAAQRAEDISELTQRVEELEAVMGENGLLADDNEAQKEEATEDGAGKPKKLRRAILKVERVEAIDKEQHETMKRQLQAAVDSQENEIETLKAQLQLQAQQIEKQQVELVTCARSNSFASASVVQQPISGADGATTTTAAAMNNKRPSMRGRIRSSAFVVPVDPAEQYKIQNESLKRKLDVANETIARQQHDVSEQKEVIHELMQQIEQLQDGEQQQQQASSGAASAVVVSDYQALLRVRTEEVSQLQLLLESLNTQLLSSSSSKEAAPASEQYQHHVDAVFNLLRDVRQRNSKLEERLLFFGNQLRKLMEIIFDAATSEQADCRESLLEKAYEAKDELEAKVDEPILELEEVIAERDAEINLKDESILSLQTEVVGLKARHGKTMSFAETKDAAVETHILGDVKKLGEDDDEEEDEWASLVAQHLPSDDMLTMKHTIHALEAQLRSDSEERNRTRAVCAALTQQLQDLGVEPTVTTNELLHANSNTNNNSIVEAGASAVSARNNSNSLAQTLNEICDTTTLNIIIDCKESELRVLHYRLEHLTLDLANATKSVDELQQYVASLRNKCIDASIDVPAPPSQHHDNAANNNANNRNENSDRQDADADADSSSSLEDDSKSQLMSLLHLLKALRKQNGVLHTVLCERGSRVRHYAWLLLQHNLLDKDVAQLVLSEDEDPSAELRLAFAERDEEIFLKDQVLLQRSTEVIVLEEALNTLHQQLVDAGMAPRRPLSSFGKATFEARQRAQQEVLERQNSRAKLQEKHAEISQELHSLEKMLQFAILQQKETTEHGLVVSDDEKEEHTRSILELRSKKDALLNSKAVIDAQCAAHDQELELLRQVLAQNTRALVDMQSQKDVNVSVGVVEKLKGKFFRQ